MRTFIDRHPDLAETPAHFQERRGQIALACFWSERQERNADEWNFADRDSFDRDTLTEASGVA